MNRIVREHFPVERLPEELRVGLGDATHVRITVVLEDDAKDQAVLAELDARLDKARADLAEGHGLTLDQVRANLKAQAGQWAAKAT